MGDARGLGALVVGDGQRVCERGQDGESVHGQTIFGSQLTQSLSTRNGPIGGDQVADPAIVAGCSTQRDVAEPPDVDRDVRWRWLHFKARRLIELAVELR